ncbi:MAG: hypothetical protein APU95_02280 [Hadesarchaea archaeon YNP_N21]|jgi:hypothetical protein|nr:MAG: hypothetical protein APU95_02280 [Hadesarchaea archaeon YNP_N21]
MERVEDNLASRPARKAAKNCAKVLYQINLIPLNVFVLNVKGKKMRPRIPTQDDIGKRLARIERKIDDLIQILGKEPESRDEGKVAGEIESIGKTLDIMTLLSLPDHLRKTAMVITKLGKATAEDVAKETRRARAIESSYLNQLVRMRLIGRKREGKKVYFTIENENGGT